MKRLKIIGLLLVLVPIFHASATVEAKGKLATSAADTSEAVKASDFVFVGQVVDLGMMDLRSAARHHYHDLLFEVLSPLKGNPPLWTPPKPASPEPDGAADWNLIKIPPPRNGKPAVLTKTFLLLQGRIKPDEQNEEPPKVGEDYIVAGAIKDGEFAVRKLLTATKGNTETVRTILGLTSIEAFGLQHGQEPSIIPAVVVSDATITSRRVWRWMAAAVILGAIVWWALRRRG